jgi:hypothetical protein
MKRSCHFLFNRPETSVLNQKLFLAQSQTESYVTTDGKSASLSRNKAHIWGLRPDISYCLRVAGLLMWGALSDEKTGLSFARVTGSSNVCCQYVQFTFYMLLNVYTIYIRSLSVQAQYSRLRLRILGAVLLHEI